MKKKQVLVLLMAATLTVGTVSPVYAMETESENCEMMTEMVETAEEISSVSETEGTFSEEIAEFATTSELGVVDEAIAPDAVAVLSETVAGETLVPTQVKESVIVENTMTLSDTELTVYMKRGIGIYPIFSGEEESVTWTTTDPSVTELIYDPSLPLNIMISGLKPGTATVTCTSASGLTASCHVTVKQLYHAESVSINQQNVAMKPGEVMTLDASVYPVEATPTTELEWYSSDPSIVEVDSQTGEITALQPGTVTITVWTRNKKSGTCSVTVKDKESVDKTALKIAIETAKKALKEEDKYTEESVKVLKAAVAEAEKVAANEKATQESVDAATQAVEEAIEGLKEKPAVPEVNKDALKEAIETAKEALKEEDKYTEESVKVLKAAVAEAEKVAANEKATQESVDAATQAVEEAIEGLKEKPAVPEVNKDALKEAIETAKEALKEEDKYTEESVKVLKAAVAEAEKVAANEKATQESVDAATQAVEEAIEGLKEKPAVPEVNKDALKEAIETAKKALKEEDKYTEESVKVLKAAVREAEKVAANEKATQESVDAATQAVEEAIEGLEEKTVVPEDKDSIVKIQFVDEKGNVVAGGDYFVDKDGDGIFNHTEILEWVPEGYELKSFGDYLVELFKETPLQLTVVKSENPDQKPENPEQKPENPDQKPENPDQKPENPDQKPENPDQKPENPEQKPENPDQKPENPDQKPENPDQKPENPDQKPENPEQQPENPDQKPVSPKTGDPTMVGLYGVATVLSAGIVAKMRKSFKRKK